MGRNAEAYCVNMYVNIKEGDTGGVDGQGKSSRIAVVVLKENETRIMATRSQYFVNKPKQKVKREVVMGDHEVGMGHEE